MQPPAGRLSAATNKVMEDLIRTTASFARAARLMLSGAAVGLAAITYPRALQPLYHVTPAAETSKTGARRISFHGEQVSSNSIITYSRPQVFELIHGAAFGAARRQA